MASMRMNLTLAAGVLAGCSGEPVAPVATAPSEAQVEQNREARERRGMTSSIGHKFAEWDTTSSRFDTALDAARTDRERVRINEIYGDLLGNYPDEIVELVEQFPDDPKAGEALAALIERDAPGTDRLRVLGLLLEHHAKSAVLGRVATGLSCRAETYVERFVRGIIQENPRVDVREEASVALARILLRQVEVGQDVRGGNRLATGGGQHDRRTLKHLRSMDLRAAESEAGELLAKIVHAHPSSAGAKADYVLRARSELFELRRLAVGHTVPEIAGEDLFGTPMKLSDYRGKVVLLSFWGNWHPASRQAYGAARNLVARYERRPFALVGVNSDEDREDTQQLVVRDGLTWRSFWNGGRTGQISRQWNIHDWPTTYLLDARGIIRFKNLHGRALDHAVMMLLSETVAARPGK